MRGLCRWHYGSPRRARELWSPSVSRLAAMRPGLRPGGHECCPGLAQGVLCRVRCTSESALRCKYTMNGGTGQGLFLRTGWQVAATAAEPRSLRRTSGSHDFGGLVNCHHPPSAVHSLSSPILTLPPRFLLPESHRKTLQIPSNHAISDPRILKFLHSCNKVEHLCYNRRCRNSSHRHLTATISTLPSEY